MVKLFQWAIIIIIHAISGLFVLSLGLPSAYCFQHGCRGPELDGFMPALMLAPFGAPALALSMRATIRKMRSGSPWSYIGWPIVIVQGTTLAGVAGFIVVAIVWLVGRRR